jgi:hypothetical protein
MAALTALYAVLAASAVASTATQIKASQDQKKFMGDEAMKQEENLQKEKAAQKESETQNAAASDLAKKKARQDALAANKAGRTGTILTSPGAAEQSAGGIGQVGGDPTTGTKTLLGE